MKKPEILVIDDEIEVGTFFEYYLKDEKGFPVTVANSGKEARSLFKKKSFDLALVDLKLPDTNGIMLLKEIKENIPGCEVIIMTGYSTVKSAVEAMKLGALDYIDKPFDELEELDNVMDRALQSIYNKNRYIDDEVQKLAQRFGIIMAKNSPLKDLLVLCKKVASRKISVLIEGETGTGKEVLARFVHANSSRANCPFIGINCGALTESLLESELFGHEKGAFTGAQGTRRGIFEIAHRSTLFLDEIGEASPLIQVKLLRVLESGEFFRIGGERPLKTDVRIIAATNTCLREAVKNKLFREDLLYRLDVVRLNIPPLRERRMDIVPLINYYLDKNLPEEEKKSKICFNPEALELMQNYSWPGNVRELSNVVARSITLRTDNIMGPRCLPEYIAEERFHYKFQQHLSGFNEVNDVAGEWGRKIVDLALAGGSVDLMGLIRTLKNEAEKVIREIITGTLEKTGNNRAEASKLLNISQRVMRYLLNEKVKNKKQV